MTAQDRISRTHTSRKTHVNPTPVGLFAKIAIVGLRMILTMSHQTDQNLRVLRSLIDRTGLTLRRAAKLAGIDNTVLTDWYNGKTKPKSDKSLANLDHALKVLSDQPNARTIKHSEEELKRVGIRLVKIVDQNKVNVRLHDGESKMIEVMDWGGDSERLGFVIPDDAMDPDLRPHQTIIADDGIRADPNLACLIETSDGERMVRWAYGVGVDRVYKANDPQFPTYTASKSTVLGVVVEVVTPLPGEEEIRHSYRRGMRRKK